MSEEGEFVTTSATIGEEKNSSSTSSSSSLFQKVNSKPKYEGKRETKKYEPLIIKPYYQIGNNDVYDHIDFIFNLHMKEDKTEMDKEILRNTVYPIRTLKKFLTVEHFKNNRFFDKSFYHLNNQLFVIPGFDGELKDDIIQYWKKMSEKNQILMNILITVFIYRNHLAGDNDIGTKVNDFYYMEALIQFSFRIFSDRFPTNMDIYHVAKAMGQLSNQREKYSIENINKTLTTMGSKIKFIETPDSPLRFYRTRCPAMKKDEKQVKENE
jgi:hypothetical protein